MSGSDLPEYPAFADDVRWLEERQLPTAGEALANVFEFSIGLALANVLAMALSMLFKPLSAMALAVLEGPFLFALVGALGARCVVSSRFAAVLGFAVGVALAIALSHFFHYLQIPQPPTGASLDYFLAGALTGSFLGLAASGLLTLAGGTPKWNVGRLICGLGCLAPTLLRGCLFRTAADDIQIRARPWLEGVVWAFVVGVVLARLLR